MHRSRPAALASFFAGWLIDLDHIVDYVSAHGWKPNWERFNEASHEKYSGKLYLPLHSFELLALFFSALSRTAPSALQSWNLPVNFDSSSTRSALQPVENTINLFSVAPHPQALRCLSDLRFRLGARLSACQILS
jgi:hypothetical protein